jgi:hypothetical protein
MSEYRQGLSGRGGGSGKYSYRQASIGGHRVRVAHMPEDDFTVRITFMQAEEISIPIIKTGLYEAQCLWAALNQMAQDLGWSDKLTTELLAESSKERSDGK